MVWLGAPPCPDFSPIKGDEAPRSKGQEGQKFIKFCTFAREVESQLHPIPVGYLVENVILQDRAEIHYFSQALDCQAIVMDAADYGLVSRPRLWWTRVPWHNVTKHPFTNHPVGWSQHQKLHRLHVGEPHQDPKSIQTEGLQFHQSVITKQKVIPCFTTPAPSEDGRPAPKKLKGRIDPETKSRYLSDQRAFAPWQYSPEALMHSEDGLMHVPTPEVKEQLHMLPKGYTEAPEHIRNVYFDKKHDQITQIPILLKLLEITGFPGLTDLQDDLVNGFEVLGELHAGCGWNPRMDDKYSFPIDRDAFRRINQSYVKEKLKKNHVDQHWQVMLDELLQERDLGRISGPFVAPYLVALPDTNNSWSGSNGAANPRHSSGFLL